MDSNKNIFARIAILSIFFIQMGIGILTPAIQNIAEAFPEIPFTTLLLVSTLPALTLIPASLFTGALAEKYGYKRVTILGTILFILGGTIPYIQDSFTMILISRGVFGIGLGILFPIGNALVIKLYDGQQRANMLGIAGVSANIGAIVMLMGGAFLCAISWKNTFLTHLLGAVTLLLVIAFLPEPEKDDLPKIGQKVKLPAIFWIITLLSTFINMINYPMLLNMSTIIISSELGTASSVGVVLSMFTVGGMIGGALFGKIFQIAGRFSIGIGIALMGVGLGIVNFAGSLPLLATGTAVIGVGFFWMLPAAMMEIGKTVNPAGVGMATGIFMAAVNVGGFLSPYYMAMLSQLTGNTDIRFPLFVGMILALATALITILVRLKPEPVPEEMPS